MPKRRVQSSEDENYDSESEEDFYEPRQKKARAAPGNSSRAKGAAKTSSLQPKTPVPLSTAQDPAGRSEASLPIHLISSHVISATAADNITASLVTWYARVHATRGMPWRKPFDPAWTADERGQRAYEVWVSEIMLQQTQVATVIPYYNRWMEKFPTLGDLATSSIDPVHALWKGLGYYSRASRLLEGAKKVMDTPSLNGRLPVTAKIMQSEIPGVGRYSAGAICSIAYDERVPVLDGNVNRLLSRVLALHASPKAKQTLDILWSAAAALVESPAASRPGDLNQALIELGSTVCKPKDPACSTCPIRTSCGAYALQERQSGQDSATDSKLPAEAPDIEEICSLCDPALEAAPVRVTLFPMKAEKKKAREETDIVHVLEWRPDSLPTAAAEQGDDARWFVLVKRPEGGLLGGLQEFPTLPDVKTPSATAEQIAENALASVHDLLIDPVLPLVAPLTKLSRKKAAGAADGRVCKDIHVGGDTHSSLPIAPLRITHLQPAGEVLHIFSHIRKTYCVRWVVVQGGVAPPTLRAQPVLRAPTKGKGTKGASRSKPAKGKGKARRKGDGGEDDAEEADVVECVLAGRWVRLDEVRGANIGTGVVKIWDRVRALWETS